MLKKGVETIFCVFTFVLGSTSGSAGILAKISHNMIPKEKTSTYD